MHVVNPVEKERETILEILKDLGEYYGKELSNHQLEMYLSDLMEMGSELTLEAAEKYRRKWGSARFPFPGELREMVHFTSRNRYLHYLRQGVRPIG